MRWLSLVLIILSALHRNAATTAEASAAAWSILFSTNAAGPYVAVTNVTSATGFVKLQGPAGQSAAAGMVLTISNAVGLVAMSNGTIVVTAPAATTNDYAAISAANMPGKTNPVILNLQGVGQ